MLALLLISGKENFSIIAKINSIPSTIYRDRARKDPPDTIRFRALSIREIKEEQTKKKMNQWIADRLKSLQLSQSQLASVLGISAPAVSGIIAGSRKIQVSEIIPISETLKIPIETVVLLSSGLHPDYQVELGPLISHEVLERVLEGGYPIIAQIIKDMTPQRYAEIIIDACTDMAAQKSATHQQP